jgi:hypothetical protein
VTLVRQRVAPLIHFEILQETAMTSSNVKTKVTLKTLAEIKANRQRFACVTAYDSAFAEIASSAGIEVLLVGDSLGMVLQVTIQPYP